MNLRKKMTTFAIAASLVTAAFALFPNQSQAGVRVAFSGGTSSTRYYAGYGRRVSSSVLRSRLLASQRLRMATGRSTIVTYPGTTQIIRRSTLYPVVGTHVIQPVLPTPVYHIGSPVLVPTYPAWHPHTHPHVHLQVIP